MHAIGFDGYTITTSSLPSVSLSEGQVEEVKGIAISRCGIVTL